MGAEPLEADARSPLEVRLARHLDRRPTLGCGVYIAPGAVVIGDVTLGDHASVWYHAVLRGDLEHIEVGHHSNIQDNAVLHLANDQPCRVGAYVTVGHGAIVHACTVGDEVLVGMGAILLDRAVIGTQSIVGAGAVVPEGLQVPPGSLVLGVPARVVRPLRTEERVQIRTWAEKYVANAAYCLSRGIDRGAPGPEGG